MPYVQVINCCVLHYCTHICTVYNFVSLIFSKLQQGASLPVEAILRLQLIVEAHSFVSFKVLQGIRSM